VPYEPEPYLPPSEDELDAMTPHKFNRERTDAKNGWYYFMKRIWQAALRQLPPGSDRDGKIDQLQQVFRDGREYIFGPEPKGCGSDLTKKPWKWWISYPESWRASRPEWYHPSWVKALLDVRRR